MRFFFSSFMTLDRGVKLQFCICAGKLEGWRGPVEGRGRKTAGGRGGEGGSRHGGVTDALTVRVSHRHKYQSGSRDEIHVAAMADMGVRERAHAHKRW